MKNSIKSRKSAILLASVITSYLIFIGCSNIRHSGKALNIKKWVNWQVEFKNNTSEAEKTKALIALDKYIMDYLNIQNFLDIKITSISFFHAPGSINRTVISIQVHLGGEVSTDAVSTAVPKPHPPKKDVFEHIAPVILDIIDLQGNGNFTNGASDKLK